MKARLILRLNDWRCRVMGCAKDRWNEVNGLSLLTCWRHARAETKAVLRAMVDEWEAAKR